MIALKEDKIILRARNITKSFGGIKALDGVSLEAYSGRVTAIVGENGAGKTTLMKVLSGVYQDYEGQIFLDGREVNFPSPKAAQDNGIAIIHQELNLIPYLSVAENIFLGREFLNSFGLIDYKQMNEKTSDILEKLELHLNPQTPVCELRVGRQQVVEIAKALSLNARIIIMDEPTSAISEHEIEVLFNLIRTLTARGVAIIYITHKLDELFEIGDEVAVLRDGKYIGSSPIKDVNHDEIVRMMVGRDIEKFFVKKTAIKPQELFKVEDICLGHPSRKDEYLIDNVSLSIRVGEVLGIFGLMGAGRTELLETIFGLHPKESTGKIFLDGEELLIDRPTDAIDAGIAFLPEDRKLQGLIMQMSVGASITLASIEQAEHFGFLNNRLERKLAQYYIERLSIKTPSVRQMVANLSGGNQQKVVIAKWLATDPKVILMDEPTRGIDVNAKNEIYGLISELTSLGLGIVMVSSELPEIMAISDRIVVLSEGKKTAEFGRESFTKEQIMKAAIPKSFKYQAQVGV